jgi:hypothetical protein
VWLLVRSPTLCGSPTVMSNLGFAACSSETLGCVCRCVEGLLDWNDDVRRDAASSPGSESIRSKPGTLEEPARGRPDSFDGTLGGCSKLVGKPVLPSRSSPPPNGPRGSSTVSSLVV